LPALSKLQERQHEDLTPIKRTKADTPTLPSVIQPDQDTDPELPQKLGLHTMDSEDTSPNSKIVKEEPWQVANLSQLKLGLDKPSQQDLDFIPDADVEMVDPAETKTAQPNEKKPATKK